MTQYLAVYRASNGDLRRIRTATRKAAEQYRPIAASHGCELHIFTREKRGRWRSTFHIPKTEWGPGPWQNEPDELRWRDKATNLHCVIVRSDTSGSLCGYVGVSRHHPGWGKDYNDVDVSVHGGLTFYGLSNDELRGSVAFPRAKDTTLEDPRTGESFTFKARPGALMASRSPLRWWYGFDTAHAWDYSPHMIALTRSYGADFPRAHEHEVYRDLTYVKAEVESLARQLQTLPRKGRKVSVDLSDSDSTRDRVP